jgi:hypothetical protein
MDTNDYDLMPTDEIIALALVQEDGEKYWDLVRTLKYRATWEVFEAVRALTESDDADRRYLGVEILSEFGIPKKVFFEEVIKLLVELLDHETDEDVIGLICIAFARNPNAGVVEPLVKLKKHKCAWVREAVAHGLLTQDDDLAVQTMIELSNDPCAGVRNWATFGLGRQIDLDTPEIRQALLQRVDDDEAEIRGEALIGLAERGDERVINPLIDELKSIGEAEDNYWNHAFEAAMYMGDARLYPELAALEDDCEGDEWFDRAIAACRIPGLEEEEEPDDSPTTCPVCGLKNAFSEDDSIDYCTRCGWHQDPKQRDNPDMSEGWNQHSLKYERERWKGRLIIGKQQNKIK